MTAKADIKQEPEGEVVQSAVTTSTVPQPHVPTSTLAQLSVPTSNLPQPPVPTSNADTTSRTTTGEALTVPSSTRRNLPALSQSLPFQTLELERNTIQPVINPVSMTHTSRQHVRQLVRGEARPTKKRMTYHHSFTSFTPPDRDAHTNPLRTPSAPAAPATLAATAESYKQVPTDYARPTSRVDTSTSNRRPNPTLGEPTGGETWPDAPTIGVSNFRLARSMPRRLPKKDLVHLDGSKPRICDNAGCSGYHSHKDCTLPSQCKGCGSLDHFWGQCKCSCGLCGAQQHTAELCFTIPVSEDRKQRSGNPSGYCRGFFCKPQHRGPALEDSDPLDRSGGKPSRSYDRNSSRRPKERTSKPDDTDPWARPGGRNSAYEDMDPRERSSCRTPGHDHRRREGRWGQERPYPESDEGRGHLGPYSVSGRKRSPDMMRSRSDRSVPTKRMRMKEEDEA